LEEILGDNIAMVIFTAALAGMQIVLAQKNKPPIPAQQHYTDTVKAEKK
jgi:hypothetical protein